MTLSTSTNRIKYAGDDVTTSFPVPFKFFANSEIGATLAVISTGVETTWAESTNYTLTGAGADAGGTLVALIAPTSLQSLTIVRTEPETQNTDYPEGGAFPAAAHEDALDKLTMLIQQLSEKIGRTVSLAISSAYSLLTLPDPSSGKFLRWNAGLTGLENASITSSGSIGLPVSIADGGTNAATVAAARANIFDPIFTTKGDLVAATGNAAAARLGIGGAGTVLQPASGATPGLAYLDMPYAGMINGRLSWTVAGNALTVALKTASGADPSTSSPVLIPFRSVTATTDGFTWVAVTAALSVVVSSGSTLGTVNSVAFKAWCVALNNAGAVELAVFQSVNTATLPTRSQTLNQSVGTLAEFQLISTTAEGGAGAADSAATFYSTTARSNVAARVLGYGEWNAGLATAGTWASGPTAVQLHGPGIPLPGSIVKASRLQDSVTASGSTVLPFDDVAEPQNTEGVQFLSLAHVVVQASNMLRVSGSFFGSNSGGSKITACLFQDSVANARASFPLQHNATADMLMNASFAYERIANAAGSTTFNLRAGSEAAGTMRMNTSSAAGYFATIQSSLQIDEVMT